MAVQKFHLLGDPLSSVRNIEVKDQSNIDELKFLTANQFSIVRPKGKLHSLYPFHRYNLAKQTAD